MPESQNPALGFVTLAAIGFGGEGARRVATRPTGPRVAASPSAGDWPQTVGQRPESSAPRRAVRRRSPWKRAIGWAVRIGVGSAILIALFLPYPYETGGPFQFLPSRRVEVRSEVEGLIERILVSEGQWVEPGEPLARIASRVHEKNLKAAEGQLEEAKAQLRLLNAGAKPEEIERARAAVSTAETALAWSRPRAERFHQLYGEKIISDQEHDNALRQRDLDQRALVEAQANLQLVLSAARQESVQAIEAQIASLDALVRNYKVDVQRTVLKSPIAGVVVTPRVEQLAGTYLKPAQRDLVLEIEDSRVIRAEVQVPETGVADIRVGAAVEFVTWAYPDTSFHGLVVSIAPVAGADSSTSRVYEQPAGRSEITVTNATERVVRVTTEIANTDGLLKPEMTGYAKIAASDRPVWSVILGPIIRWCQVTLWYWIP